MRGKVTLSSWGGEQWILQKLNNILPSQHFSFFANFPSNLCNKFIAFYFFTSLSYHISCRRKKNIKNHQFRINLGMLSIVCRVSYLKKNSHFFPTIKLCVDRENWELAKNGINRPLFIPFRCIKWLDLSCVVAMI